MSDSELSEYEDFKEPKQKKRRNPPSEPRKLMRWNPDVDQLVLLSIDAVCSRLGVALPWEEIAKEVNEHLSAEGVKQHLGKIRIAREKANRKVPSKPEKARRKSRANEIKKEEKEDAEKAEKAEKGTSSRLAGLLYHVPETKPKKERTPRKNAASATTPGSGKGKVASATTPGASREKPGRKMTKFTLDREKVLGTPSTATPTKVTTGKRGRKTKVEPIEEEDSDYAETPTKKTKSDGLRFNLRATTEVDYSKFEAPLSDNEEDEENLLTNDEDASGDYQENEDVAVDGRMEDVKSEHAPSPQKTKNIGMAPQPAFNVNGAASGRGIVNQISGLSPTTQPNNFQPPRYQLNPLQASPYYDYDQGVNAAEVQDLFSNNTTPRTNAGMNSLQPNTPLQVMSALRSTLNESPVATKKEKTASKKETNPKTPGNKSSQKIIEATEKTNGNASLPATRTNEVKASGMPSVGSPFGTIGQANNGIEANVDMLPDFDMNNYSTVAPNMDMTFDHDPYVADGGFGNGTMAYSSNTYGMRMGMGNPNLHLNTGPTSLFATDGFINSPDEYNTSAGSNIIDSPLNFLSNVTYGNNVGGLPMANKSNVNIQQFSQALAFMPPATHTESFDSMATTTTTTVYGSQTDEANPNLNVDGGNDTQADNGMENNALGGGFFDNHFDAAFFPDPGF